MSTTTKNSEIAGSRSPGSSGIITKAHSNNKAPRRRTISLNSSFERQDILNIPLNFGDPIMMKSLKIPSPKNAIAKNLHNSLEELNFDDLVLCPGDSNSLYLSERSAQYCDIFSRNSNSSCSPMFFVKDEASVDSDSSTTPDEENVSKFVTRAPPMGCEKLKPNKPEACGHSSSFQPFASTNFQLKQSSSSAFSQPLLIRPKPKSALAIATSHAPLAAEKEQPDNDDENDANKDDKQEDSAIANIASTSNK